MNRNELAKVILRVVLGLIFFVHGLDKFQGGIANIVGYFESLGIPGFLAYVVALIELVGGLAMILGIGTKIVAALFAIIMIGAIFTAKLSLGLLGDGQMAGYEIDLALLAMSVYFLISTKSVISLDYKIFSSK
ncbi:DoxX family protein [Oceanobacillus saliphilus]|uniref:DoxX family protein n=1 Tax=Oceanobacillus saliphilus TaxID=2925834 RepID=UPI00201E5258|nr:DoxX family protein [Oceanobacillus saliphilus]